MKTKLCSKCNQVKPVEMFPKRARSRDGLQVWCKECFAASQKEWRERTPDSVIQEYQKRGNTAFKERYANDMFFREQVKERVKAWRKKQPKEKLVEKGREYYLHTHYRLTPAMYKALWELQQGRCGICGKKKRLDVDHDHKDGRVRGLICRRCNVCLAGLGDNEEGIMKALAYLQKHETLLQKENTDGP